MFGWDGVRIVLNWDQHHLWLLATGKRTPTRQQVGSIVLLSFLDKRQVRRLIAKRIELVGGKRFVNRMVKNRQKGKSNNSTKLEVPDYQI